MVFDHSTQACQPDDIPDTPARALRDSHDQIQLLASHYTTRRSIGPTLGSVAHGCSVVFGSHSDPDPSNYNGQEWLHSVYTIDGQKIYGFVHQEFHGWDYYEQCAALTGTPDINKCWYNAVTLATSTDAGANYTHAAPPGHLLASVPYQFAPLQGPYGVYRPSNVVAKDGLYYMMVVIEGHGAQKAGECLIRTDNLDDPKSWRAWDGSGFNVSFINPYVDTTADPAAHVCEPVSSGTSGPLRGLELYGLVYSNYLNAYVAWGAAMKDPAGKIGGFYYSLSADLIHWSEPILMMKAEIPLVSHQCGDPDPVRDASLVDPASTTRSFETIGRNPYLYMTRFNYYYDGSGACSMTLDRDLIRIPIEFGASNEVPTASFWLTPSLVQTGQPVTFNASESSDPDGIIKKYEWDFDENGTFEVDSGSNPIVTHSFPSAANVVTVKLRVTDNRGGTSETTRTLGVTNRLPTASFTVTPSSPAAGQVVTFDGSASSDPDGSIVHYLWDLDGNGSLETDTGTQPTATMSYPAAGSVTARLRVIDSNGGVAETTRAFTVTVPQNQVPTASFTAPSVVLPGDLASFDGSASSDTDGSIANYRWDLDGNGSFETDTGTTSSTSHTYTAAGTVTVRLRVTDSGGATGETSRTVVVNAVPKASFSIAPDPAITGQVVTFDASGSSDTDGSIANYKWDLDGNGSFETDTGAVAAVTRSYPAAATLTVMLRVTDDRGATSDASGTLAVSVLAVPPTPAPITAPPQAVFPPAASTGQSTSALPACSSIRKQRRKLVSKRNGVRRKLAKAKTGSKKRHYGAQVRALNRKISRLAKTRCSA
jgi:PKD repeat protein